MESPIIIRKYGKAGFFLVATKKESLYNDS